MAEVNEYDMTWNQWLDAATLGGKHKVSSHQYKVMRREWRAGVDPTEWAAHFERAIPQLKDGE